MKIAFTALVITCLAVTICACDDGEDPASTATPSAPTSTPAPAVRFEVRGPSATTSLGPGTLSSFATYVLDTETRQLLTVDVTEIERSTTQQPIVFAGWTVAGTLRFIGSAGSYEVTLDGKATATQFVPTLEGDPSEPAGSADGAWRATRADDVWLVTNASASVEYRLLGSNVALDWAPRAHLAAFGTGPCHGGDLHVFDPDGGTLYELTGSGSFVLDWAWHPDGTRIAANFMGDSGQGIAIFAAALGSMELLVPSNGAGELAPLKWSDDGRYLAFRYRGGRDFGCGEGGTEPPYVPPSLERVR